MKHRRFVCPLLVLGLSLLPSFCLSAGAAMPEVRFQPDGQPDPGYAVPDELSLNYALAFALDNNFAIRNAKEAIRQQEGILLEVRSVQIPTVTASLGVAAVDRDISPFGDDRAWGFNITARQVVYAGGGVTASVKAQRLGLDAASLRLQAVINAALLDVRTKFYGVLVARERIKVQESNVTLHERQLQDIRNRFAAGTVSNFEVLRAEVALANAQPALISARNNFRIAVEELRQSLGFVTSDPANVGRVPEFAGTLEFKPQQPDLASALSTARAQRPDLQALRKFEEATESSVKASRAGRLPTVSIYGSFDSNKSPISHSLRDNNDGFTVGVQSTWDIFDGRATSGRIAQAKSGREQAHLAVEEAELSVAVEVRRAFSSLQEAAELATASQKVVEQAEEAVRLAEARYGAGTATQLDVLTTQVELTTARLNQLEAYYRHNVATAALRTALGLPDAGMSDN